MLTEDTGRTLLKRRFSEAGYAIEEDHRLQEEGVDVVLDGFDPRARVGYEFITTEAGDRERLHPEVLRALEERMHAASLYVLVVDELDIRGEAGLLEAAAAFLDELRLRGKGA